MPQWLSPKQAAQSIGVSESSLKRWCDRGILPSSRTAGGHRRVPLSGVISYLRDRKLDATRPEILGLPHRVDSSFTTPGAAVRPLVDRLSSGDCEGSRSILLNLFMGGASIASIGDELVSPAMEQVGEHWECGEVEVYQERLAVEIATRTLHEMSRLLPVAGGGAPRAIGGTAEGDQYGLATLLVESTLRELGWQATSLGSNLPFETLLHAGNEVHPQLFWLSISRIADRSQFTADLNRFRACLPAETVLVVGGRASDDDVRKRARGSLYCDDLRQLAHCVASLDARRG